MLKQKCSFLALAVIMMAGFVLSANAQVDGEPEERETTTGAVFTRDTSYPYLREAWRDPDGLIWGDVARYYGEGAVARLDHYEATDYCDSIGARLPSRGEFVRLREYMGAQPGTREGYIAQVLPNLLDHLFWSSSVRLTTRTDEVYSAYVFYGTLGSLYYQDRDNKISVRCVVGP